MVGNPARQPYDPARGGDQAAFGLGQAELRLLRGDDDVAGECDLETTGEGVSLDGRDERLARRALDDPTEPAPLDDREVAAEEAFRSIPAQNVPPAPVMTIAVTSLRSSSSSREAAIPRATAPLIAFLALGRLMVMTATPSSTATRTSSDMHTSADGV